MFSGMVVSKTVAARECGVEMDEIIVVIIPLQEKRERQIDRPEEEGRAAGAREAKKLFARCSAVVAFVGHLLKRKRDRICAFACFLWSYNIHSKSQDSLLSSSPTSPRGAW